MPHPLEEWLPNDAPWARLSTAVLEKQCTIRNLPTTGHSKDLVQRLSAYSQAEMNTSDNKRLHSWLTWPVNRASYEVAALAAGKARLQVVRVVDKPVILRFVLNCPEPYLWQRALLPSELQTIYQHSHAIRAFGPNNSEIQIGICMLCFRDYNQSLDKVYHCLQCGRGMHSQCSFNSWRVRKPMREDTCWICYDIEWDIEKFSWSNRVLPAAPSTAPAVPAQNESAVNATRELIQRTEPEDDDSKTLSSSSDEDSEDSEEKSAALSTSIQSNESIPSPDDPALIWKGAPRTCEQQHQEKKRQQTALLNLSATPSHVLFALNPSEGNMKPLEVATARDTARIPAGDSASPRASSSAVQALASSAVTTTAQHNQADTTSISAHNPSIAGGISHAPQVSVNSTTATSTKSADATSAQQTTSIATDNPASPSAPLPTDHSASTPVLSSLGMHACGDHTKAMELVLECSRLAKKSVEIQKKSEREAKRRKKRRREMKKTKRKSKKKVKRLEKKIESLEKEVLKALAGPEVV
ncbi:hypothetical protein NEUTE1DRAFT_99959 [Neurospora tetrasperma FGSC 2508]|uniref:SAP domain-containing protein n=1 Tax=Neurospora tetrasperma (strain FGSC 2508 / ATCC MYA-4615 / P0657) TaxID=510951 RepID=F8MIK6_NEUT8|nr:uncharacterized protein NEUTE1DRAFT_99959 [Neurospora tetrasperma FGSC 2508]EGO59807.1 hypothetical protein NEUTE1DRAFT_99959 [Neurospora tetrasperma FGSC 2508]